MATTFPAVPRRTTEIWSDTIRRDVCRHRQCRKPIVFAQIRKTGKIMPFDDPLIVVSKQPELGTSRESWRVDLDRSHFITCVGAKTFRRPR